MTTEQGWNGSVDPNSEEYQGGGGGDRTRWCKAGKKVLVPLGYERWTSNKGSPMLSVRFLCVADLEKNGTDEGSHVWRNFALTQKAVAFFARFAKAMKHTTPFNVFNDEDIAEILGKGAVVGKVETETYTYTSRKDGEEKTGERSEVKFFDPYEGDWDPDWDALVATGEEEWDSYLEWRDKNPRGSSGGDGGGGGGGGGQSRLPGSDEDIPF